MKTLELFSGTKSFSKVAKMARGVIPPELFKEIFEQII